MSEWFVDALKPATQALGLSEAFTGLDTAVQNLKPELSKTLDNAQTQLNTVRQNVGKVTQNEIDKWKRIVKEAKIPPLDTN